MLRTIARLGWLLLLGGILVLTPAWLALSESEVSTERDPVTISSYQADYRVDEDGSLHATETISATFPAGRHGIFRYWDVADQIDSGVRYLPRDLTVTMDGADVPVAMQWQDGRRYRVAKIGNPNRTLRPGEHVFEIRYQIDGVIAATDTGSRFEWQAVAAGWNMRMQRTDITVTLPHPIDEFHCRAGSNTCEQAVADAHSIRIAHTDLAPRTPIRVAAKMTAPAPSRSSLPWSVAWDRTWGTSVPWLLACLGLSALGLLAGLAWARLSRENAPGEPLVYAPPPGLGPVQTHFMTTETITAHALSATVAHLADLDVIDVEESSANEWAIIGRADRLRWAELDPVAQKLGDTLNILDPGNRFLVDGTVESGRVIGTLTGELASTTRDWAESTGLIRRSYRELLGRIILIAAFITTFLMLATGAPLVWILPTGLFVAGGIGLLASGVGWRRTHAGRGVWAHSAGFARFLSTKSSKDRFDFAARRDLYLAYIPFAIALGVADAWAERYRTDTGSAAPEPPWWPVHASGIASASQSDAFASFDKAVVASIGAYAATQSSSSSSGGGFSGGGGGGGGGGSW